MDDKSWIIDEVYIPATPGEQTIPLPRSAQFLGAEAAGSNICLLVDHQPTITGGGDGNYVLCETEDREVRVVVSGAARPECCVYIGSVMTRAAGNPVWMHVFEEFEE